MKYLYQQLYIVVPVELFAVIVLICTLHNTVNPLLLTLWFWIILICSMGLRSFLIFYYHRSSYKKTTTYWLRWYQLSTFFSGISWGFMGSLIMPYNQPSYQALIFFILLGITTGSNSIYSANRSVYGIFLFSSFGPFTLWLFAQGGALVLLGFCACIYILVMFFISANTFNMFKNTFILRFQHYNLDSINQHLEQQVDQRTSELNHSLTLISSTLESIDYGILVMSLHPHVYYFNQQLLMMWGLSALEMNRPLSKSNKMHFIQQLEKPLQFFRGFSLIKRNPNLDFHDEIKLKDGRIFERHATPHLMDNQVIGHVWGFRDVTIQKELENHIIHQANYDSLTELPNRTLLYEQIAHNIELANRFNSQLGVMFIDIDHFKDINDALGHNKGDLLLQMIAKRIRQCIRKSDVVARFGGDEFILLFLNNPQRDITQFCEKILRTVAEPIKMDNELIHTTASIGVCFYPQHGSDANNLIKNADTAMYLAKKSGRNLFQIYNENISLSAQRQYDIQQQLLNALPRNEFELAYQPIIDLKTHQIVSVEALLRWNNPVLGNVPPQEFIPIAEDMGIIVGISQWMFEHACRQNKRWQDKQAPKIVITVNIGSLELKRDSLIHIINQALDSSKLSAEYLGIELTESSLMETSREIISTITALKNKGIEITIDDFGTGYSSFRYLSEFPAHKLKIERSLIPDSEQNHRNVSIIRAIINMCHQLDLKVIAEGVETPAQLKIIKDNGCDEMQGFVHTKPLTANELYKLLVKTNTSKKSFTSK